MTQALERVGENAEHAATHLRAFARACEKMETSLSDMGNLLLALLPYVPLNMRAPLYAAGHGLYNASEGMADAGVVLVADYRECLLLAQQCAGLTSVGKEPR